MKKGMFALSKTAEMILILLALIVLVFFIYYLRDKVMEYVEFILGYFSR